ncbi:hypothetical protein [Pantoea ananatis]|uniref:Uncharacterized protein n=1 Tax=Pantoea ananas TaxID=553 RepID=A0AAJ1D564_PANAN|nr:hypothetical protein [Pantoea ananatis]MCW0312379.1 hypothetical protein [Pantoea ananatis]MCW0346596.1 hypothetical protein [Pantoea ananatis]MCW0354462.1 hypothetical protein [Pantoea ananatis]MDC7862793.1 hypothetical protein [Pantoea ananatis]USL58847.1 hypothetical protein IAQ00_03315 [Pantoea ananatis]
MANTDNNTNTHHQIVDIQPVIESAISNLLKTPLGTTHDLFQVLDTCVRYVDALVECNDIADRMALCGRLLAALEVLRVLLDQPLPEHLIERLTVDKVDHKACRSGGSIDSEEMRQYCSALTLVLLNQQAPADLQKHITGLLFQMVSIMADDLTAPRFLRTESGLMMIESKFTHIVH